MGYWADAVSIELTSGQWFSQEDGVAIFAMNVSINIPTQNILCCIKWMSYHDIACDFSLSSIFLRNALNLALCTVLDKILSLYWGMLMHICVNWTGLKYVNATDVHRKYYRSHCLSTEFWFHFCKDAHVFLNHKVWLRLCLCWICTYSVNLGLYNCLDSMISVQFLFLQIWNPVSTHHLIHIRLFW